MIRFKIIGFNKSDSGGPRWGDCTIIDDGSNYLVVDGYCGIGTTRLISRLKSLKIKNPVLFISHAHYDHYYGIRKIINDKWFSPACLYMYDPSTLSSSASSDVRSEISTMKAIVSEAKKRRIPVKYLKNGDKLTFGEIKFNVYHEQPRYKGNSDAYINDGSLCFWFPELLYLTTGDAGMWCANRYNLHPVFVKGGHHGNDMSGDGLKPSQMAPWLKNNGCIYYWDNDISPNYTQFLMTGREDCISAGMKFFSCIGDIDVIFVCGKATITKGSSQWTYQIPYKGTYAEGWVKDSKGWWYRYKDGTWAVGWALLKWSKGTDWFYFDSKGYMVTGWQHLKWSKGTNWFYFDETSGAMRTGWIKDKGWWYWLDQNGAMLTGWITYKGKKCYLEPVSGKNQGHAYCNCTAVIDGKRYTFDKDCYVKEGK